MPLLSIHNIPWKEYKYGDIKIGRFFSSLVQLLLIVGVILIIIKYIGSDTVEQEIINEKKKLNSYKEIIRLLKSIDKEQKIKE